MFAVQAGSQVMQYQQQVQGVKNRNRSRLNQFDRDNESYLVETMLNNNVWKNDVIVAEYETEDQFRAMVGQWEEYDAQLDSLFADADFKLQESLISMYKADYAGEQTGVTAGRRAAQTVREHGQRMAKNTAELVLNQNLIKINKERSRNAAQANINSIFEKVRFPPVPGQTPIPPELEAKPSMAGLVLGIAGAAVSAYGFGKAMGATNTNMTNIGSTQPVTFGQGGTMGTLSPSGPIPGGQIYTPQIQNINTGISTTFAV
jgi:hypothetical protein